MARADVPGRQLSKTELSFVLRGIPRDRRAVAMAIGWAESRGVTNALRPAALNSLGGNDRGTFQFNDVAFPDVSDREAYSPIMSGERMAVVSKQGTDFGPWAYGPNSYRGESRGDLDIATMQSFLTDENPSDLQATPELLELEQQIADHYGDTIGGTFEAGTETGPIGEARDAVGVVLGWAQALAQLLNNLLSADFWRRIGIGALGVALVIASLVLASRLG